MNFNSDNLNKWKKMKPGDIIDAPVCVRVTLVRHTKQSGIDGVEVMHPDGTPRYLNYVDLDLSAEEFNEILEIWKRIKNERSY